MNISFIPHAIQSFEGIYKIKASQNDNKNKNLVDFLTANEYVLRISNPFKDGKDNYIFAITRDNTSAEMFFENNLLKRNIQYWKSLPFFNIANKKILNMIFEENKKLQGKENWII